MNNLQTMLKAVEIGARKHSPEILTGIGIAGMTTGTILAVKATPKAMILIDERKAELKTRRLKKAEIMKVAGICYIPAGITIMLSAACLIGSNSINLRRNAALATAYSLSETALKEYQEKVIETIGERKEEKIRDAVAKDKLTRDPVTNKEVILTGRGETLCYDTISCRYFKCDIEKIKKLENELNGRVLSEMFITLNEYYYELGLVGSSIGDEIGWTPDHQIDFDFSSQLTDDGTPCLVVGHRNLPKPR